MDKKGATAIVEEVAADTAEAHNLAA